MTRALFTPPSGPDVFIACRYDDHPILCPEFRVYPVTSPPAKTWTLLLLAVTGACRLTPVVDLPIDESLPLGAVIVGLSNQPMMAWMTTEGP